MLKESEGKLRRILFINMVLALCIMSFETYAQQHRRGPGPMKRGPIYGGGYYGSQKANVIVNHVNVQLGGRYGQKYVSVASLLRGTGALRQGAGQMSVRKVVLIASSARGYGEIDLLNKRGKTIDYATNVSMYGQKVVLFTSGGRGPGILQNLDLMVKGKINISKVKVVLDQPLYGGYGPRHRRHGGYGPRHRRY